jgi:hypothetical protein
LPVSAFPTEKVRCHQSLWWTSDFFAPASSARAEAPVNLQRPRRTEKSKRQSQPAERFSTTRFSCGLSPEMNDNAHMESSFHTMRPRACTTWRVAQRAEKLHRLLQRPTIAFFAGLLVAFHLREENRLSIECQLMRSKFPRSGRQLQAVISFSALRRPPALSAHGNYKGFPACQARPGHDELRSIRHGSCIPTLSRSEH